MIAAHADRKYEKQPRLTEPDGVKINKWENLPLQIVKKIPNIQWQKNRLQNLYLQDRKQ